MARVLTRPLFRKGGLSQTPRPTYRGGGLTTIRPRYRNGGMNGIMSGIVPRRGYANGPATPEEILERIQVQGLPYLTMPKIEDKYQKFIKRKDPITYPEEGSLVAGYGEGKQALHEFYQTPEGEEYIKKPLVEKMKEQVAKRKAAGLPVSDDAIVEEQKKQIIGNGLDTNGVVDTRSQFEKYFNEYLPVIQEQLGPDSDAMAREKWLQLASAGLGVLGQPGGDLAGAIGKEGQKAIEGLSKISGQERQAEQVPKMLAMQAALDRIKAPTSQDRAIDASRIDNIAKDITGRSTLTYETAYKVAEQLDDLRKSDSKLAGKFNKEMPSEPKEIAKIKGPKYFYTNEGDLKVVKDGTIYSLKEWQSQKEV